jgi:hypothetical protein
MIEGEREKRSLLTDEQSFREEKRREMRERMHCKKKKNDDDLLNSFLSLSPFYFSYALYLNNVESSHLSSFGLS